MEGVAAAAGTLLRGGPRLEELAWQRRRSVGDRAFSLVEGCYDPGFRDLLFSPKRTKTLERAFVTLLAGEIDRIPFGVGVRCQALRGLCALQRVRPVAARVRPFKITQQLPQSVTPSAAAEARA